MSEQWFAAGEANEEAADWFPETDFRNNAVYTMGLMYFPMSVYYGHLAEDPPDSDYTSIIQPTPLKYQPVSVSSTTPAAVANAFNALYANQAQAAGLAQAIFITNNRADAALEAHDASWEQKQMQAAATYALQSAALLESQTQLLVNLQTALSANGFPTITITQSQVDDFKTSVAKNGLPASMLQALTQMGVDQATINDIRNSIATQAGRPGVLPALLSDPLTQDALRNSAQGLRAFALNNMAGQKNVNAVDDAQFFASQHYLDFLNRSPDAVGLNFWTHSITTCGTDGGCVEVKRINASAAFFLSIEFQETGFYAIRVQRAAFGHKSADASRLTLASFLPDARTLGDGVVVGIGNWQQRLEQNKQAYAERVAAGADFAARFPETQTAGQYVAALYASAGVTPPPAERDAAVAAFGAGGSAGRAAALRKVAESASLTQAELNPAFVLMEYFGYLRRDPDASGYNFWLGKLNQFNGNFVQAEMVKAFISADEYRHRFGQ